MADKDDCFDWYLLSFHYLEAADTLTEKLLKRSDENYDSASVAPALYNFKHAIELFCKFLLKNTGDFRKSHYIDPLLSKIFPIEATSEQLGKVTVELDINISVKEYENVYHTTQKYFKNICSKYSSDDPNNTSMRYPHENHSYTNSYPLKFLKELREDIGHVRSFQCTVIGIHSNILQLLK